jgi:hypothetical protein
MGAFDHVEITGWMMSLEEKRTPGDATKKLTEAVGGRKQSSR